MAVLMDTAVSVAPFVLGGPAGLAGADSIVPGPKGDPSTVPGPAGAPGQPGTGTTSTRTASTAIPPSTYVVDQAGGTCAIADPTNPAHRGKVLGLVVVGVTAGSTAVIQTIGPITGATGTFGPSDALFIGDGTTGRLGSIVNTPPASSATAEIWRQQVGTATTVSLINGLLGPAYRVPATGSTAIVGGPNGYATTTAFTRGLLEAAGDAAARLALGAAPTNAPEFTTSTKAPLTILRPPTGGQNLAVDALGVIDGFVRYWAGEGTNLNRTDASAGGAIGQGRIFAPQVHRWTDRLDNGTSDGSVNDPYGQPSNGINTVSLQLLEHTVGGGTGVRETQRINTIFDTPSKAWNVNRNYVASRRRVSVAVSDSGSSDRPAGDTGFTGGSGAFFTDNPEAFAGPNAKNLLEIALSEGNVGIMPGGSARILYGHSVVKNGPGQGDVVDAAFSTGTFTGSSPFKDQFLFSDLHGDSPLDPNGTIMRVGLYGSHTMRVKTIFDFANLNYTNILALPQVDWRSNLLALTNGAMQILIPNIPASDPHSNGYWYRDSNGFIKMSLG